jgi:uncharacterized membrane protein
VEGDGGSTSSTSVLPPGRSVQSRRVIFIDLGRALAVAFMLYGHTVSALLAAEFQTGTWFDIWQFQRGLTSSLFLLLAGFAFSIATARHWASHVRLSAAPVKRIRRFALFILLGYALHLPVSSLRDLPAATSDAWRAFQGVDVLQLIGVTFIGVQLLVVASRTRWAFTLATLGLAAAALIFTPAVWAAEWPMRLPGAAAAYLTPATGSLFPLFPWVAFVLLGAGLGQVYGRWGAANLTRYANVGLIAPGVVLLAVALAVRGAPTLFGTGPGAFVPGEVLTRAGACLLILGAIAHLSRRIHRLPHLFGAVAQESLLIYFVHLCIVYGSVWNRGLLQVYGPTLAPLETLAVVVVLIASMAALAGYWNWWKHSRPRLARGTMYAVWGILLIRLL